MKKKLKKRSISKYMFLLLGLFMVFGSYSLHAQEKAITGTITSLDGMVIPGVNIVQKGTTNVAISDFDGKYSIKLVKGSNILVFSFIGFKSLEKTVSNGATYNIVLQDGAEKLDEVVVVGYGTTKKVNLTGAVGVAKGEVLENRAISTVGQGLQGVLPGLNITVKNGDPSQSVDFNIRGYESINGGSPLILVDNVPMDLNQINPNDIESISVLKDAASAAIYGARAAFGVILVTTKKGKKGKVNVTLSTEQTFTTPIFLVDPVTDPLVYMTNQNLLGSLQVPIPVTYDATRLGEAAAYNANPTLENAWSVRNKILYYQGFNDYQNKVITDLSLQKKYDLSVSGASDEASYYASFGYLGKKGYLVDDAKNQKFERFNALLKADFKINEWLSLNSKIIYTNTSTDEPHNYQLDVSINTVNRKTPIQPLVFPDLAYYLTPGDRSQYEPFINQPISYQNALPYLEQGSRDTWTKHDIWFTQGLAITPTKGFIIKSDFSYNAFFQSNEDVASKINVIEVGEYSDGIDLTNLKFGNGFSGNDYVLNRTQYNQYFAFNVFGEYTYEKLKNHYFKGMAGFNQEELRTRRLQGKAAGLITPGIIDLNTTTGIQEVQGGRSHYALRGAFFRFNYDFKGKYLLEVNGRYDGTSRFPQEDRFGFFPSFSAGWRISEESFMQGASTWLSNLKVRASYGELGNQIYTQNGQQNYYPYIPSLSSGNGSYTYGSGAIPTVSAAGLVSPTLTWESVNTKNIGLDVSFLKNRLDFSADMYVRATKDMLLRVNLPDILGAPEPLENGADLETKGWELAVNWRDKIGEEWKYGIGINLSDNQTKITKYGGLNPSINSFYKGKNIGEIWGFESVGLFKSDADAAAAPSQSAVGSGLWKAGDVQYADLDGNGKIDRGTSSINSETGEFDKGDLKVIGNTTPRYSFGLTPRVEYKGLSLNVFFQGLLKRDYYADLNPHAPFWPYNGSLVTKDFIENSWSPTNTDTYFARPRGTDVRNIQSQTRFLQNAAYIRLKNVTLNYNVSKDFVSKLGMSNASIYLSGQNLWEFSKMRKTLDPEQTYNDNLRTQYYFERSLSLGLKATF